jgi:hypothetical protein
MMKQQEREARTSSQVVPNLACMMDDSSAPSGTGTVPVPSMMSQQEEDLK